MHLYSHTTLPLTLVVQSRVQHGRRRVPRVPLVEGAAGESGIGSGSVHLELGINVRQAEHNGVPGACRHLAPLLRRPLPLATRIRTFFLLRLRRPQDAADREGGLGGWRRGWRGGGLAVWGVLVIRHGDAHSTWPDSKLLGARATRGVAGTTVWEYPVAACCSVSVAVSLQTPFLNRSGGVC